MEKRDGALDLLKIFATVIILLHHFQQLFNVSYGNVKFCSEIFDFGIMVELFFIISGYFTYKWSDRIVNGETEFGTWIKKKCTRLLPMMGIAAIAFEMLIFVYKHIYDSLFWGDADIYPSGVVLEMLGVQSGWIAPNNGGGGK